MQCNTSYCLIEVVTKACFHVLTSTLYNTILGLKNTSCLTKLLTNITAMTNVTYQTYNDIPGTILAFNTSSCDLDLKVPSEEYWT
jgi:hypothetical protein